MAGDADILVASSKKNKVSPREMEFRSNFHHKFHLVSPVAMTTPIRREFPKRKSK